MASTKKKTPIIQILQNLETHGIKVIQLVPGSEIGFVHISKPTKLLTTLPSKSIPDVLQAVARRNEIITHYHEIRKKHREELEAKKTEPK